MSIHDLDEIHVVAGRARTPLAVLFYGGLGLLMLAIFTGALGSLLPTSMASHISDDSEAYVFALLLSAWVQWGVWRLPAGRSLRIGVGLGVLCALITILLLSTDLPGSVKTLNETFFALAILIPYVSLRRPLGWWPHACSIALILAIVGGVRAWPDSLWLTLAEGLTIVVLAPWAFDVLDRTILESRAKNEPWMRSTLYGVLIAIPVFVVLLGVDRRAGQGLVPQTLDYIGRSQESFVGLLLVLLYLALVKPTGSNDRSEGSQR